MHDTPDLDDRLAHRELAKPESIDLKPYKLRPSQAEIARGRDEGAVAIAYLIGEAVQLFGREEAHAVTLRFGQRNPRAR